jgi:hypothetical protein
MVMAVGQVGSTSTAASPRETGTQDPAKSTLAKLRTLQGLGRRLDAHDPGLTQQAAAQLLSELFYKPMLAEMRSFPFGRSLGGGGLAEDTFGQQLDQRIADTVAASDPALVQQIARRLQKRTPSKLIDPPKTDAQQTTWPLRLQLQAASPSGGAI